MTVDLRPFGTTLDGQSVVRIDVDNGALQGSLINYGARLVGLLVPDRAGRTADVVLGHDELTGYENGPGYLGATCGRYGNRIRQGRFTLDGTEHHLDVNEAPNTLHGGSRGFDRLVWTVTLDEPGNTVGFSVESPDGDQGFPGSLRATVSYVFDGPSLRIRMDATTDAPTVVNLVHHSYWNLAGDDAGTVHDHELTIHADAFTPVDDELIPTGEIRSVDGSPFDFRQSRPIGSEVDLDHNWVLDGLVGAVRPVAVLRDPRSGRTMHIETTEAGLQCYSGAGLGAEPNGKSGIAYPPGAGVALESQCWPDSPNIAHFPSSTLRPDESYHHELILTFADS